MKSRERAISVSLILHLALSLTAGVILSAAEGHCENVIFIKILSAALLVVRYFIPIFLYCKAVGFIPFVSPLNATPERKNGKSVGKIAFLFIFGITLTVTVLNAVGALNELVFSAFGQVSDTAVAVSQEATVYSFIKTVCLAAIAEEILFRGAVLHAFSDRSDGVRIAFSALTFALMHGNIRQFFYALAAGLVIAFFAVLTNSLTFAVLLHFGANLVTFVFSGLRQRFAAEIYTRVSLITFSVLAVISALCAVWYFLSVRKEELAKK